jgi:Ca2+-binding EF-hand superfamily protein
MKLLLNTFTALAVAIAFTQTATAAKGDKKGDKTPPTPEEAFKKLDKDNDGSVTLDEFKASGHGKKDPAKAEGIYKKMDKDSNSKLTLEEFKAHGPKPGKKGAPEAPKADAPKPEAK